MSRLFRLRSLACATALVASLANAQYHVSTAGNDRNPGTKAKPWRTLTWAATAAPTGARIHVAAGDYGMLGAVENVRVTGKRLSFIGAGVGLTTVDGLNSARTKVPYKGKPKEIQSPFVAYGPDTVLNVSKLSINVTGYGYPHWHACVAFTDGASGDVVDCELNGPTGIGSVQGRVGIIAAGRDLMNPSTVNVRNCWIHKWNKCGVLMGGNGLTGSVIGCTIVGGGRLRLGQAAQNGIQIGEGGGGFVIRDNLIRDVWYEPGEWNACGILVHKTTGRDNLISGNQFFRCKAAYYHDAPQGGKTRFTDNVVGACFWGVYVSSKSGEAFANRIDATRGVEVVNASSFRLDRNTYGDFRSNLGYPTQYLARGNFSVRDLNPASKQPGFHKPVDVKLPRGASPSDMALGDFNGDGRLDVATANSGNGRVRVQFGSGGTNFIKIPPIDVVVGGQPEFVVAGEFSGSKGLDLAVLLADGRLAILTNDGSGKLTVGKFTQFQTKVSQRPIGLVSGNFDRQNEDDLALAISGGTGPGFFAVVAVKNGSIFRIEQVGLQAIDIEVGDGNRDGSDEVYLLVPSSAQRGRIYISVWQAPRRWIRYALTSTQASRLGVGDIDGDTKLDIAVLAGSRGTILDLWRGDGALGWSRSGTYTVEASAQDIRILDAQNDSSPGRSRRDIVLLHDRAHKVSFLENHVFKDFTEARSIPTGLDPRRVDFADLDGNGLPDMLVCNRGSDSISVALADPFALAQSYGIGCWGKDARIPMILPLGRPSLPTLGNMSFGVGVTNARASTICALLFSPKASYSPIACSPQIGAPVLMLGTVSDAQGRAAVAIPIPNAIALRNFELYSQWLIADPQGRFLNTLSLSEGLRLRVGGRR